MARSSDPTEAIRLAAESQSDVVVGTSCNQSSFKVGSKAFLYIGPGAKGPGFKAMFKLERSLPQASERAAQEPDRFQVGAQGWVTTRFTAEKALPKSIWERWLKESYALAASDPKKRSPASKKKPATKR
ncbi:MAG: hypothetical protein RL885_19750 [Planctomycetota bacterium]